MAEYLKKARKIAEVCERSCSYETMLPHGISCKIRKEKYAK